MRTVVIAAALTVSLGVVAIGIERKPLPAFDLIDVEGRVTQSTRLSSPGPWLIVYVRPDCPPCETVLRSVDLDQDPALPSRIVVVVGTADLGALQQIRQRFPALASSSWYADASTGAPALGIASAPAVVGVRDGIVQWSVAGVLNDATDIRTIMTNWVNR
jgi:hypothetical protein